MKNVEKYQVYVSELIEKDLEENPNFQISKIKECSKFSLVDGKRLRPLIVLTICNCLNDLTGRDLDATRGALCIEYIHNSSLIIDDMPMMDNDKCRRDKPTVHFKYGQCIAQLVAYNLIVVAMRHLFENLQTLNQVPFMSSEHLYEVSNLVYREFTDQLSINGLCGGQYLDLHVKEEFNGLSDVDQKAKILELIRRKTSCLFEISFILGWILGGGIIEKVPQLRSIGRSFGLIFQITDDLADLEQDLTKSNNNNVCQYYNQRELTKLFIEHLEKYKQGLIDLQIFTPAFKELYNYLLLNFKKSIKI